MHGPHSVQLCHVLHDSQRLLHARRVLFSALVEATQVLYQQLVALCRLQGIQQLGGFVEAVLQRVRLLPINK
jgi:outer membrane protein TolC